MQNRNEIPFKIKEEVSGASLVLYLEGRLDVATSKELDAALENRLAGISTLTFDLTKLDYISSAGLRSLLIVQKTMCRQGKMLIRGANELVMDIFHSIGFDRILTIV